MGLPPAYAQGADRSGSPEAAGRTEPARPEPTRHGPYDAPGPRRRDAVNTLAILLTLFWLVGCGLVLLLLPAGSEGATGRLEFLVTAIVLLSFLSRP